MLSLHSFIRTTRRPVVRVKVTVVRTPTWSCARRRVGAGVDAVVDAVVAVAAVAVDADDCERALRGSSVDKYLI